VKLNALAASISSQPNGGSEVLCLADCNDFDKYLSLSEKSENLPVAGDAGRRKEEDNATSIEERFVDKFAEVVLSPIASQQESDVGTEILGLPTDQVEIPIDQTKLIATTSLGTTDLDRVTLAPNHIMFMNGPALQQSAQGGPSKGILEGAEMTPGNEPLRPVAADQPESSDKSFGFDHSSIAISVELKTYRKGAAAGASVWAQRPARNAGDGLSGAGATTALSMSRIENVVGEAPPLRHSKIDTIQQTKDADFIAAKLSGMSGVDERTERGHSAILKPAAPTVSRRTETEPSAAVPNQIASALRIALQGEKADLNASDTNFEPSFKSEASLQPIQLRVLEIVLQPAELGRVAVTLRLTGASLSVSLSVENRTTKDILDRELSSLKEELSGSGYEIEGIHLQEIAPSNRQVFDGQPDDGNDTRDHSQSMDASGENTSSFSQDANHDQTTRDKITSHALDRDTDTRKSEVRAGIYI
jgi:hypothetical protein